MQFTQLKFEETPTESRDQEGVGLGLYLAREIVASQGGYIKVQSKLDEGSIFSIFLQI